jgi:hypothetical protein
MSILAAINDSSKSKAKNRVVPDDTQQVCIDLPGEEVRCYVHKSKLEIMLRKHRDVIFDIQLFKGMSYTVEADQSDFYNARDKKIVIVARKQKVAFKDGERMHLHVGRGLKGHLILKANGKVLGRYAPSQIDGKRYDDDPVAKPAPLIVAMKNPPVQKPISFNAPLTDVPQLGPWLEAGLPKPYTPLELAQPQKKNRRPKHACGRD